MNLQENRGGSKKTARRAVREEGNLRWKKRETDGYHCREGKGRKERDEWRSKEERFLFSYFFFLCRLSSAVPTLLFALRLSPSSLFNCPLSLYLITILFQISFTWNGCALGVCPMNQVSVGVVLCILYTACNLERNGAKRWNSIKIETGIMSITVRKKNRNATKKVKYATSLPCITTYICG